MSSGYKNGTMKHHRMRAVATTTTTTTTRSILVGLLAMAMPSYGFPVGSTPTITIPPQRLSPFSTSSMTTIRTQQLFHSHSRPRHLRQTQPRTSNMMAVPSIPFTTKISIKEDHRYSANDWLHNMYTLPRSTILQEVKGPVTNLMLWSFVISGLHRFLIGKNATALFSISSTPHSFLVSALGLLLVFRTNSAYQRFSEGRQIWEQILSVSRNLTRYTSLYQKEIGQPRQWRMVRLLAAFPYLLQSHITALGDDDVTEENDNHHEKRSSTTIRDGSREDDGDREGYMGPNHQKSAKTIGSHHHPHKSISATTTTTPTNPKLPWSLFPPKARAKCMASRNRPLWVCDRLAQEVIEVAVTTTDHFTSRERSTFLNLIDKLTVCVGECERIHQTAVPQNYARHSLRSLTIWLWTLPFCLVQELGIWTVPVMGVTAWLLFGVYQIGGRWCAFLSPYMGLCVCVGGGGDLLCCYKLSIHGTCIVSTHSLLDYSWNAFASLVFTHSKYRRSLQGKFTITKFVRCDLS
jgi:predicted membrane chloride channel (bestrophin family)